MVRALLLSMVLGFNLAFSVFGSTSALAVNDQKVLITEIKLGGGTENKEFVEIYNDGDSEIDLTGWAVEYAKASFDSSKCSSVNWKAVAAPSSQVNVKTLSGLLPPGAFLVVPISINDSVSGSARLISQVGSVFTEHDLVGWGEEASCIRGETAAPLPANGSSITRVFDPEAHPKNTFINSNDWILEPNPTPGSDICLEIDCYEEIESPDQEIPEAPPCLVAFSEVLANPLGTDSGNEYFELHNPTQSIQTLEGCKIKFGASAKEYAFSSSLTLEPMGYLIIKATDLSPAGLQITNAGGEIWLFDSLSEQILNYPQAEDDEAWSLIGGEWQATDVLTPGAANKPAAIKVDSSQNETLEPCGEGKVRNPETNRCKNIEQPDELAPCREGQARNPDTNRCRNKNLVAELTPCREGQVRNPETNRCRSVAGASTTVADCKEGYERNPATNRCRKVTGGLASPASFTPASTDSAASKFNYFAIGLVSLMALAYGCYEYRNDLANSYSGIRSRISRGRLLK